MSQKKNPSIESLLKSHFVGLLSIIESILCLESLLEMLMVYSFARQEAYDRGDLVVEQREE